SEPVHVEYAGRPGQPGAHIQPVLPVVAEVVTAERLHGHRVAPYDTNLPDHRRRSLGGDRGSHQHAVLPVASLVHERSNLAAPSTEYQGRDRHALRILRAVRVAWILPGRNREARIRVSRRTPRRIIGTPLPVDDRIAGAQTFPPRLIVGGQRDIGE